MQAVSCLAGVSFLGSSESLNARSHCFPVRDHEKEAECSIVASGDLDLGLGARRLRKGMKRKEVFGFKSHYGKSLSFDSGPFEQLDDLIRFMNGD